MTAAANPHWFLRFVAEQAASIRLYCFPYAGAGASSMARLRGSLPSDFEVVCVQLPGRETRYREAPARRLKPLATEIAMVFTEEIMDLPFAFFGHSYGALLAFETARQLRRVRAKLPIAIVVSGHGAPQLPMRQQPIHCLEDQAFRKRLTAMNGIHSEILGNAEYMSLLIPTLRADLEAAETYDYLEEPPLPCPIVAFTGRDDPEVREADVHAWATQTAGGFRFHCFEGEHFFIHTQQRAVARMLSNELRK